MRIRWRRAVGALAVIASVTLAFAQSPRPLRIVSTSPSITETLFALGLGDRVVGVSTYCRFPPEVLKLPKVGTFLKPNAEVIAGLRPDLVLVHDVPDAVDRQLASLNVPFVTVREGALADVLAAIRQIADAAGVADRAGPLIAGIQRTLDDIRKRSARTPHPRVLFIMGRQPGALADLIAVGRGSYINDLIEIGGGTNALTDVSPSGYLHVSMETVLQLDPDVVVDTVDMGETEKERADRRKINERLWDAFGTLSAVKNRRIYAATTDALVVPGPRVVEAAEWVASLLARAERR